MIVMKVGKRRFRVIVLNEPCPREWEPLASDPGAVVYMTLGATWPETIARAVPCSMAEARRIYDQTWEIWGVDRDVIHKAVASGVIRAYSA